MSDIIITPASGKIDFYQDLGAASLAKIELTSTNDLALSTTSGNLIIGDASRDIYIGNGINDVDIIFEQNGEIRPLPSKTLNIGTSGSFTQILASKVNINQNSFTSIPLDVYSSTSGATILNVAGTKGTLFSVTDSLSGSLMSVNNDAGLPVFEVFSDDRVVAGRFGQNDFIMTSSGNVGIGTSSPVSKLQVSGLITANSGNFTQSLQVNGTGVSISGHTHTSSNITDFNSSVSGLLPTIANSGNNRILTSTGSSVGVNAEEGLTFDGSTLNVAGLPNNDPLLWGDPGIITAGITNGPTTIVLHSNTNNSNFEGGSWGGGVISLLTAESAASTPTLTITPFGFVFGDSTVQSSAWIGSVTSSQVTDFNSSVSGLLPTIANSGDNRVLTSTGSSVEVNAESNLTFNGNLLSVTGSGSFSADIRTSGSFIGGSGTASLPSFEFINDPDTGMFSPSANTIGLATSGVERLRINNIGRVGIGTTVSDATLHVNGTFFCGVPGNGGQGLYVDDTPLLRIVDSGPNYVADIDANGLTLYGSSSSPFFYTDRNNARIGIGTATPDQNLSVVGSENVFAVIGSDLTYGGQYPTTTLKGYTWFGKSDGSVGIGAHHSDMGTFSSSADFYLFEGFNESVTAYTPICLTAGYDPQLFLNTDLNVGIGTATPYSKLQVNGGLSVAADGQDVLGGGEGIIFGTDGSISSNDSGPGPIFSVNQTNGLRTYGDGGASNAVILSTDRANLRVGIGTDTPESTLHIVGDINCNSINVASAIGVTVSSSGLNNIWSTVVPISSARSFMVKLSAYNTTNTAAAGWHIRGLVKRLSTGNPSIVGTNTVDKWNDATFNSSTANVITSGTSLVIQVSGFPASSTSVRTDISYT